MMMRAILRQEYLYFSICSMIYRWINWTIMMIIVYRPSSQ